MCTRYALEKDLPKLKDIFEIVKKSPLTSKFVDNPCKAADHRWRSTSYRHSSCDSSQCKRNKERVPDAMGLSRQRR